jgi:hypothetical protein
MSRRERAAVRGAVIFVYDCKRKLGSGRRRRRMVGEWDDERCKLKEQLLYKKMGMSLKVNSVQHPRIETEPQRHFQRAYSPLKYQPLLKPYLRFRVRSRDTSTSWLERWYVGGKDDMRRVRR